MQLCTRTRGHAHAHAHARAQDYGHFDEYDVGDGIHIATASLAALVWVRSLGMVVPIYPSLGPLLNTIARMAGEIVAFVIPMFVVMIGFSTMLTAVLKEQVGLIGFRFWGFQGLGLSHVHHRMVKE